MGAILEMAMQQKTWSLNALSVELNIDRRTLSKRLSGLRPAETKQLKNRVEKRWRLADVLTHLQNPNDGRANDEMDEFKRLISDSLYPSIVASTSFGAIISNGLQDELGLTEAQGLRAFQLASAALNFALCEVLEDDDIQMQIPDFIVEMHELGIEGYLQKYAEPASN